MKFRHLVFLLSIIFLAACTRIEEQTSKIYVNLGETIQSVDAHTGEITLLEFNGSQITVSSSGSQFAYYTQELTSTHILVNDGINTEEVA